MDQEVFYFPSHLDDQPRFFFWDVDEFMAMMLPLGMGIFIQQLMLGVVGGFILSRVVRNLKSGRGPGIMIQAMYWYLPSDWVLATKITPPSHLREFVG